MVTLTTPLPPAPQRGEGRDDFSEDADSFADALVNYQVEQNLQAQDLNDLAAQAAASAASAVNAPGTSATSASPLTIGFGDQALVVQTAKAFVKGQWVTIAYDADVLKYMIGTIKSYDAITGNMVVSVQRTNGAGTFATWTVSLSAAVLSDSTPRNLAAGSTVKDKAGGVDRALGFRGLPTKLINTAYTVTIDDVGFCLEIAAGGSLILPRNSTLAAGSQFTGGDIIVFQEVGGATKSLSPAAGATLRQKGTTNVGVRTIKAYGGGHVQLAGSLADLWFGGGDLT